MVVFVELDFKILAGLSGRDNEKRKRKRGRYLGEFLEAPLVVLAWVVAREVGGRDIRDGFSVDAYDLC